VEALSSVQMSVENCLGSKKMCLFWSSLTMVTLCAECYCGTLSLRQPFSAKGLSYSHENARCCTSNWTYSCLWLYNSHRKSNKMQQWIKIFYFIFIWSSTCFGRHIAHHQEPKTALAASGFAYVEGCWTCSCWTLSADSVQQLHVRQPSTYAKPEAARAVLGSWWWAVCRPKHVELHVSMK